MFNKKYTIPLAIFLLIIFAFILRSIAYSKVFGYIDVDPYYHLRLIELFIHNFPRSQPQFDWMTAFPNGDLVFWGPMMTWIGGIICIILGATTQQQIIDVTSWIPPILGALLVPVVYYIGKETSGKKLGLVSAAFVAIVPGLYFYRSIYGYFDHHIFEVFFGTLFCLAYLMMVKTEIPPIYGNLPHILQSRRFIVTASISGILFFMGTANMPTMLIFALIVFIFSIVELTVRRDVNLVIPVGNLIIFTISAVLMFISGIISPVFSLYSISSAHIAVYAIIIAVTGLLYLIQKRYKERGITIWKSLKITAGFLGLVIIIGLIFFLVTVPTKELSSVTLGIMSFFNNPYAGTIAETAHWSLDRAVSVYSSGLLIAALGFAVCIKKYRNPLFLFIAVWSAVMLGFTISSMRFEYYLGVNIAILAATGIVYGYGYLVDWSVRVRETFATRTRLQRLTKYMGLWIKVMLILGVVSFIGYSIYLDTLDSSSASATMPEDWNYALSWLKQNTPADGMDYYTLYPSTGFSYPSNAYSIMTIGDYGHWILAISHRMPVSNPFQSNLGSTNGVATFFMTEDPEKAYKILDDSKSKYIIVDQSMTGEKLENIIAWSNPKQPITRYISHGRYTTQFLETTLGRLWYSTMDNIHLVYTSPHKTVKIFQYRQ